MKYARFFRYCLFGFLLCMHHNGALAQSEEGNAEALVEELRASQAKVARLEREVERLTGQIGGDLQECQSNLVKMREEAQYCSQNYFELRACNNKLDICTNSLQDCKMVGRCTPPAPCPICPPTPTPPEPPVCPEPEPRVCPEPEPRVCPEPEPRVCPEPEPHVCPEPEPHVCPEPEPHVCPEPVVCPEQECPTPSEVIGRVISSGGACGEFSVDDALPGTVSVSGRAENDNKKSEIIAALRRGYPDREIDSSNLVVDATCKQEISSGLVVDLDAEKIALVTKREIERPAELLPEARCEEIGRVIQSLDASEFGYSRARLSRFWVLRLPEGIPVICRFNGGGWVSRPRTDTESTDQVAVIRLREH